MQTRRWWMALLLLAGRLVASATLVTVPGAAAWMWLTLVQSALWGLHLIVQPYEQPVDNSFESLTLFPLVVQSTPLSERRQKPVSFSSAPRNHSWTASSNGEHRPALAPRSKPAQRVQFASSKGQWNRTDLGEVYQARHTRAAGHEVDGVPEVTV